MTIELDPAKRDWEYAGCGAKVYKGTNKPYPLRKLKEPVRPFKNIVFEIVKKHFDIPRN